MFKSNKHRRPGELELLPPVKGLNTLVPPDAVDKLSAVELNGEITDGKIGPQYGIESSSAGSFLSNFNTIVGDRNRLYGHKSDGIYEINGASATRVVSIPGLTSDASIIRWDDGFVTINNGDLYVDDVKVAIFKSFTKIPSTINKEGKCVLLRGSFYYGTNDALWKGGKSGDFSSKLTDGDFRTLFVWGGRMFRVRFYAYVFYIEEYTAEGKIVEFFRADVPEYMKALNIDYTLAASSVVGDIVYAGYLEVFKFDMVSKSFSLALKRTELPQAGTPLYIFVGAYDDKFIFTRSVMLDDGSNAASLDLCITRGSSVVNTISLIKTGFNTGPVGGALVSAPVTINDKTFAVCTTYKFDGHNAYDYKSFVQDLSSSGSFEPLDFIAYAILSDGRYRYLIGPGVLAHAPVSLSGWHAFVREGRVVLIDNTSTLMFSGIGDPSDWTQDTDMNSLFIEIGYKDGGKITEVVNGYDVIVFKDNGKVYRLSGSYPNWRVNTLANTEPLTSNVKTGGTSVLFGTASGVKELITSQAYGDYLINDMRARINLAGCKFIHISQLRGSILFAMPDGVYEYKPQQGTFTKISGETVDGIYEDHSQLYVKKYGSIYRFLQGGRVSYKYGRILSEERFLIGSVAIYAAGSGSVSVDAGGKVYEFACDGGSEPKKYKKRNIFTTNVIQPKVTVNGADCSVLKIIIEYSIIGG